MTPYNSEAAHSYSPDWKDAAGSDPAWDEPRPEPNLETSTEGPSGDTQTEWRSADVFTITLQSGQTIEVKFAPALVGELRMHQFDFTGPVSATGFKSHFVSAVESEQFPHPRDYAQVYAEDLVARFEAGQQQPAKSKKRARPFAEAQAPQRQATDNDSSTQEPTMAEDETPDSHHTVVEVVEELSLEEEADRQRLELKVERAFYGAALALQELHNRKLYRSTHSRFDHYCRDRFGFSQQNADLLIRAARVIDNLKVTTIGCNFLPTSERQVRPLTKLKPDEQRQVWEEAVDAAGGKVPNGRVVKGIVERLKERNTTPSPIPFQSGDVVLIRGLGNPDLRKYDGQWAITLAINEYTVTVALNGKDIPVKPQFLEPVEPEYWADIKAMNQRITRLHPYELDPMQSAGLEVLRRRTYFTPKQITLLKRMENDYGVV